MPGTDLAYGAKLLRACHAMPGTKLWSTDTLYLGMILRACDAIPGTDEAYGATDSVLQSPICYRLWHMDLHDNKVRELTERS
eukprot:90572-Rhodomonas_salina.5